jgi:hypothetical protein
MGDDAVGVADAASPATGIAAIRCRQRVISTVTYDEQYVIPISARVYSGIYLGSGGPTTIAAAAPGTEAYFLFNPVSSSIIIALTRLAITATPVAATAFPTAPLIYISRNTFTGTHTGSLINQQTKIDTAGGSSVGRFSLVSTGTALGGSPVVFRQLYAIPAVLTAVGINPPSIVEAIDSFAKARNGR